MLAGASLQHVCNYNEGWNPDLPEGELNLDAINGAGGDDAANTEATSRNPYLPERELDRNASIRAKLKWLQRCNIIINNSNDTAEDSLPGLYVVAILASLETQANSAKASGSLLLGHPDNNTFSFNSPLSQAD